MWAVEPIRGVIPYGQTILAFSLVRGIFGMETNGLPSGVVNTGGFLGAVSLPVLFGLVLDRFAPGKTAYTPYAFHAALAVCGLLSLTGLLGSGLLLKRGSRRSISRTAEMSGR